LRRAGQEVERRGGGALFYWVHEAGDAEPAVATAEGFTLDRELFEMRTPLPLQSDMVDAARPIVTRPFVPGVDEEAWLEVNNRAFAGHPEQSGWDMADLRAREAEPWFDPHGLLLLELEGRLAGSCWTKVHEEVDPHEGEIFVIAVDPDFEHQGLGRALTVAGYAYLAGLGLTEGILYVDAANTAAVSLYRSLGLEVVRVDRAYVRTMPNQP
jgi:mycothiol synthase